MFDSPTTRRRRLAGVRAGFALPLAILALALITASIVASYTATSAETVSNNAFRAQDHAYQLAESGLQQFMLRRGEVGFCTNCVADPAVVDSEWTRVSFVGGYATVVAMRVRPKLAEDAPAVFFVRSTGVDTMVKMSGSGSTVYATRTIGQYASFGTATIKPLAAWTSLMGITNYAALEPADGDDECNAMPDIAGFVVPDDGQYRRHFLYHNPPDGSPPVDSSLLLDTLKNRAGIDWNAIQNYEAIPADITSPPAAFPAAAAFVDTSYWPVIRVKGDINLPNTGRGLLIVDGDLSLGSNYSWEGIILVGGGVIIGGTGGSIKGAMVSGLNLALPGAVNPPANTFADNDVVAGVFSPSLVKHIRYNSCKTARAAQRLKIYFAWYNTWLDNVAMW